MSTCVAKFTTSDSMRPASSRLEPRIWRLDASLPSATRDCTGASAAGGGGRVVGAADPISAGGDHELGRVSPLATRVDRAVGARADELDAVRPASGDERAEGDLGPGADRGCGAERDDRSRAD